MSAWRKLAILVSVAGVTLMVLLALLVKAAQAAGARPVHKVYPTYFRITSVGDTAQIYDYTPSTGLDSFVYRDTINDTVLTYQTPAWALRLYVDTALKQKAYLCSVYVNGTKRAIAVTTANAATYDTVQHVLDTLKYIIDNVAGLKDSVVVDDSTTFLLVRAKFTEAALFAVEGTGKYRFKPSLGSGTTASRTYLIHFDTAHGGTTVARVCDTMVAKINAKVGLAAYVTATDGATKYTVTSDKKGLAFVVKGTDSTQDTAAVQLNVTSQSVKYDTVSLASMIADDWFCNTYDGYIIVNKPADTFGGIGALDTCVLMLKTSSMADSNRVYYTLESTLAVLPCTLKAGAAYAIGNDTLWGNALWMIYKLQDTTSDTNHTTTVRISVDLTLKNQ